jgi:hypothetical protein
VVDSTLVGFLVGTAVRIAVGMARFMVGLALGPSVVDLGQKLVWWRGVRVLGGAQLLSTITRKHPLTSLRMVLVDAGE